MTLSILIPVFNCDASGLIDAMLRLVRSEDIEAEIIVADDASTSATEWMRSLTSQPEVRLLRNTTNQGRARTRNMMAEAARGEWLLMVDADAAVTPQFSLLRYIQAGTLAPVVCGGLSTPASDPGPQSSLRYLYERDADSRRRTSLRQQQPYRQLSTFNLFVRRDIFLTIRFDDTLTAYGYEDALFGIQLMHRQVPLLHIDNPLLHTGIDTNEEFLTKTEAAMTNLAAIAPQMQGHSRLLDTATRCRRWHIAPLIRALFTLAQPHLRRRLLSPHPSLRLFSIYKLGYLLRLM